MQGGMDWIVKLPVRGVVVSYPANELPVMPDFLDVKFGDVGGSV